MRSASKRFTFFLSIYSGILLALFTRCNNDKSISLSKSDSLYFACAVENGILTREALNRCDSYLRGWLANADPATGLIPSNLQQGSDVWDPQNAAADNYPFMVLTSFFTDDSLFRNRMVDILNTERKLTTRLGTLTDTWSFSKNDFYTPVPDTGRIIFGASEYVKDGLVPVTEWLGPSPWSERMIELLDGIHEYTDIFQESGGSKIGRASTEEVNGEMLQALSRVYWMTGEEKYLDRAIRIGDFYLLGDHHPTSDLEYLRLRDHGCELISGLCELYFAVNETRPLKKQAYQQPLHTMLDRILKTGRNEHGMFYDAVNPVIGEIVSSRVSDTWGYTLNGYYTVYEIDGNQEYLDAIHKVFSNLNENYRNHDWEGNADGYADAIESALNLYNRIPDPEVASWIDSEIQVMWSMQQENGIIEGWHGDGNFARTSLMYQLCKTKGTYLKPWREDLKLGAEQKGDSLYIYIAADSPWQGKLFIDRPRHKENLNLPSDYPRINQFPEWFTIGFDESIRILKYQDNGMRQIDFNDLESGISIDFNKTPVMLVAVKE